MIEVNRWDKYHGHKGTSCEGSQKRASHTDKSGQGRASELIVGNALVLWGRHDFLGVRKKVGIDKERNLPCQVVLI